MELKVNGETRTVNAEPGTPLLWVLRDHLGLTGTKYGCGVAQCGACTIQLDGVPRRACVTPVSSVVGRTITTIEGLEGKIADAVRQAWEEIDVPQCGYCQAGQIMTAEALLRTAPNVDDTSIDRGMAGNVCRCASYMRIRKAIKNAAESLER